MEHYAGIDVSLESASVCVVEVGGRIVREAKVASEPDALIAWFGKLAVEVSRIGLEAGSLIASCLSTTFCLLEVVWIHSLVNARKSRNFPGGEDITVR